LSFSPNAAPTTSSGASSQFTPAESVAVGAGDCSVVGGGGVGAPVHPPSASSATAASTVLITLNSLRVGCP
jgi:hypothetical protein